MKTHKVIVLIILLSFSLTINALQNSTLTHYSSENGLSQNTVMSMLQDHNGIIWLATWDGINKFDGYTFKTYKAWQGNFISLANNRVDYMAEDKYGYIWILTYDNRAHRFNPGTETFEQVPKSGEGSMENISSIKVLPNGTVWLFTESGGAIRVKTDESTCLFTTSLYSLKSTVAANAKVHKVELDREGNEWLLTDNGIRMIQQKREDVRLRTDRSFYSFADMGNEIFFGSDRGHLWRYQKKDGKFSLLKLPSPAKIISVNKVSNNEIVATTEHDGFFVCNTKSGESSAYNKQNNKNFPQAGIQSVYVDKSHEVWFELAQAGGICHFNTITKQLKHEVVEAEQGSAARSQPAFHIHEDVNGYLWVHPYGGGLSYYDRTLQKLMPFYNKLGSPDWRFSNKLHSAMSDKQGNLWMCTHSKGVEKITFVKSDFKLYIPIPHDYETLGNDVRSLYTDKDQRLWVGIKSGSVRVYDKNMEYLGYLTEAGTIAKSGKGIVGVAYCITQDSRGVMWIATKGDGLVRAVKEGDKYKLTRYKNEPDNIYSLSDNNIYSIYEDGKKRLWLATFGGGLNYIEPEKKGELTFINYRNDLKGYPIDYCHRVRHITSDSKHNIWVATTTGVLCFNENFVHPEKVVFSHYSRIPSEAGSLSNNDVYWILETKRKELYLATFGGGLNKLVSMEGQGKAKFKSYTVKDGLPSDVLLSIQEDKKGNLWISTENGLSKFSPARQTSENYDEKGFDLKVRFDEGSSSQLYNNQIAFGTSYGIFFFSPDSIRKSSYVPPITFSKLQIANIETVPGAEGSVLERNINETDNLELSHDENIFTITYAALDLKNPDNIQYAYILEGFDKDWTYVDKQRSATYTNIPKGEYVFRVKSTNSDGVWVDNERSINITVLPSFWETPFAYFLYFLFIVAIILIAVYILFTIFRLKHEVSVEQQVSDIKLRFFTNISHELRTPLTLIAGPVEYVLSNSKLPDEAREQLQMVERNTNRMLRLVNQILDFRKIQNRKMKVEVQNLDVVPFVHHIMDNFESMATEHHIDFIFESEKPFLKLWVDADKLEKIVFNLLSNAFKYTPKDKMIKVFIHENENNVAIGVQDQGIGIPESKKSSLFVRFENLIDKNLFNQGSTGIGLSLVKELAELHGASIHVDSKLGEGSCFTVEFLKGKAHFDDSVDFILNDNIDFPINKEAVSPDLQEKNEQLLSVANSESDIHGTMLLIEDNLELRFFLRSIFSSSFRVIEAANGVEGWNKATQFIPDIIISDVMMPEKDGITLTKELRENMETSHIPIVLLTAKTTVESKLEGIGYGADDYITKPFSASLLKARVEGLLAQRRKLQEFYRAHLMDIVPDTEEQQHAQPEMSANDRKFMDKITEIMEKNMDNGELIVDDLVQELAVSRSVFFKKLKMLTGMAPIEFIKEMRVKRAAQLIEVGEFNMTQISYMVGINDPRYFSKCFKQKYDMTPTEYKEKLRQ